MNQRALFAHPRAYNGCDDCFRMSVAGPDRAKTRMAKKLNL
jgi:hypothetical protein